MKGKLSILLLVCVLLPVLIGLQQEHGLVSGFPSGFSAGDSAIWDCVTGGGFVGGLHSSSIRITVQSVGSSQAECLDASWYPAGAWNNEHSVSFDISEHIPYWLEADAEVGDPFRDVIMHSSGHHITNITEVTDEDSGQLALFVTTENSAGNEWHMNYDASTLLALRMQARMPGGETYVLHNTSIDLGAPAVSPLAIPGFPPVAIALVIAATLGVMVIHRRRRKST